MSVLFFQFLIVLTLPLSFLGMAIYSWREQTARPRLSRSWMISLVATAVWATSLLHSYLGTDVDFYVGYNLRFLGEYALPLSGLFVFITSSRYLTLQSRRANIVVLVSLGLWLLALSLDPVAWGYTLPEIQLTERTLGHFDIWAVVWISSWLLPTLYAWLYVEQTSQKLPRSLYRDQVRTWMVTVTLWLTGGTLALFRDTLVIQQLGALVLLVAAIIGTVSVTRSHLPALQTTLQQILVQIVRGLLIFVLLWGALAWLTSTVTDLAVFDATLSIGAALLTIIVLLGLRWVDWLSQRLEARFAVGELPALAAQFATPFPPLEELADVAIRQVDRQVGTEGSWLLSIQEGVRGSLICRPLGSQLPEGLLPLALDGDNPLTHYLATTTDPIHQRDIDDLFAFEELREEQLLQIQNWQRTLFVPVAANGRLVGLIGLAEKPNGDPYTKLDLHTLQAIAAELGPLLERSQQFRALQRITRQTFEHNQQLTHEKRRLAELVNLYSQFAALLTPQLRQPFEQLDQALHAFQLGGEVEDGRLIPLRTHVDSSQAMMDNLIAIAARLEQQQAFQYGLVELDGVLHAAVRQLEKMAAGRRVAVGLDVHNGRSLTVWGDADQLTELFVQLLHNALKFNKIGGTVTISTTLREEEVAVHIQDSGVGMQPEQIETLWRGLGNPLHTKINGSRRLTRLGLPLAGYIARAHGGRIEAESTHGKGTEMTVILPLYLA